MTDDVREPTTGERVRAAMSKAGLTQVEVAKALGISQGQVSRRLAGWVEFKAAELVTLAGLCGVPASRFLRGKVRTKVAA